MSRSELLELCGSSILKVFTVFHNVFHSDFTSLHSPVNTCPFSPHAYQSLLFLFFFFFGNCKGVRWYDLSLWF